MRGTIQKHGAPQKTFPFGHPLYIGRNPPVLADLQIQINRYLDDDTSSEGENSPKRDPNPSSSTPTSLPPNQLLFSDPSSPKDDHQMEDVNMRALNFNDSSLISEKPSDLSPKSHDNANGKAGNKNQTGSEADGRNKRKKKFHQSNEVSPSSNQPFSENDSNINQRNEESNEEPHEQLRQQHSQINPNHDQRRTDNQTPEIEKSLQEPQQLKQSKVPQHSPRSLSKAECADLIVEALFELKQCESQSIFEYIERNYPERVKQTTNWKSLILTTLIDKTQKRWQHDPQKHAWKLNEQLLAKSVSTFCLRCEFGCVNLCF